MLRRGTLSRTADKHRHGVGPETIDFTPVVTLGETSAWAVAKELERSIPRRLEGPRD